MAVALQQGHGEVVNILTDNSQKGKVRLSPLHVAAKKDDVRAASLLLMTEKQSKVCLVSLFKTTRLHW